MIHSEPPNRWIGHPFSMHPWTSDHCSVHASNLSLNYLLLSSRMPTSLHSPTIVPASNTCATRFYRPTRASRSPNDPLEDPQSWKTTKRHHLIIIFLRRNSFQWRSAQATAPSRRTALHQATLTQNVQPCCKRLRQKTLSFRDAQNT